MPSRKKIFSTISDEELMRIIDNEAAQNPGDFSSGYLTEGLSHQDGFVRFTAAHQ